MGLCNRVQRGIVSRYNKFLSGKFGPFLLGREAFIDIGRGIQSCGVQRLKAVFNRGTIWRRIKGKHSTKVTVKSGNEHHVVACVIM